MKKSAYTYYLTYVLFAASIGLSGCSGKRNKEWVNPTIAPITEAVFATGYVEPVNFFTLTAFNEGYLKKSLVKEGNLVETNQLLFIQDQKNNTIQEQAAHNNLQIARQNASTNSPVVKELEAQLHSAEEKLVLDKLQLDRMQKLAATNSVARVELDKAQVNYEGSLHSVESLKATIAATKNNLEQALINSQSQFQTVSSTNNYSRLLSPAHYKVYEVFKKEGELVRKGEAIATLGDPQQMVVTLNVDENSINKVKENQIVLIELNTEKGKTLTGKVSKVYPYFNQELQSYKVEALFDTLPASIIAGTLLQANIIVDKKDKALLIPRACLSPNGKVIKKAENNNDTISIQTGIVSTEWVEVIQGIQPTDQVLKAY
ncbi:efflux RND transporter periplasmic adaptor subunit [Xanthocytophaga agilis]|uniref:HlyD family efflux transporter periplasmic adaptor subunit n=1 Tax=Xanthocytophaga agilis TaxID=3048010 RepID=A0AAE3R315_9BACT|nr:HlyD family efflux transporter periplasmic adaptor subunit [Xanthocytophaga agilis]MDJ1500440.1 HlyD family efflux transporter periplasmic adaptor subunit [Xanthocytophaga agilis]